MSNQFRETKESDLVADLIAECSKYYNIDPQELGWSEFKKWLKEDSQAHYDFKKVARAGGFNIIKDAYFPISPSVEQINRNRVKEHARLHRKLSSEAIRQKFLLENLEVFSKRVFSGRISANKILAIKPKKTQRIINAVLSDLHYGSDLKAEETGTQYGVLEEARRTAAVFQQIMEYKIEHRNETELELLLLGDIFQGQLHDERDGAELSEQICRSIHILSQGIAYVAGGFKKVRVRCQTGNHGRNKSRHHSRATLQKWDSLETILYYSLKQSCSKLSNVEFFLPKTAYVSYDVFGQKIFATHGDTVLNVGNPGKQINVGNLEKQVNRINASLPDLQEYSVFVVGHVHVGTISHLSNGSVVISNGALIPQDGFAVSIGLLETVTGQWIWESVPGFPVGDSRFIRVGTLEDKNPSLDKIISPWKGF